MRLFSPDPDRHALWADLTRREPPPLTPEGYTAVRRRWPKAPHGFDVGVVHIGQFGFTRQIIVLSKCVGYNPGPVPFFCYFHEDHDELLAKLQICEHYGAIYDVRQNSVPKVESQRGLRGVPPRAVSRRRRD